ncbi:sodium:solute symporter family transporter [Bordetella sp. 2513F-2]
MTAHVTHLDYWIIAGYFGLTALIGFAATRRRASSDDLFLAGRSLGPLAVGFSLFASNISSDTLVGLPGAAYRHGISAANYEWMAGVVLVFTAIFVLPVLMRTRVATMPELMERRFDGRLRKYLSVITLFLSIVLDTAGTLYAGGLVVSAFLPGFTLAEVCAIIALFTALYTASGGLRAVVYTDVMQALVLLGGAACLSVIVFGKFDYSWAQVTAQVDPDRLSLIRPLDDPGVPWLGLLTGLPIVGFYYWTMNQYVVQRVLGARDVTAASRAAIIAAMLKLLPIFLMTLPGAMATVLLPGLEHPDQVFPAMVSTFAPVGVRGLILAGLMAALMSTVSATLNSAATLITLDFVQPWRPAMSPRALAWTGRAATLLIAVAAAAWAPMIQHFSGLWGYLQQVFAFVASPLVATFLMGLWVARLGPGAALRGLACGHALSAVAFVLYESGALPVHFTILGGVLFVATGLCTWAWMRRLGAQDAPDAGGREVLAQARPGLAHMGRDVLLGCVAVLGLTAAIVWALR